MTDIDVPDWVVEVAMAAGEQFASENTVSMYATVRDLRREEMRTSIAAAVGAWREPVGKVCMNGRRYGHGLFADIEVQYPATTTPGPKIGSDLYTLRQEKPE